MSLLDEFPALDSFGINYAGDTYPVILDPVDAQPGVRSQLGFPGVTFFAAKAVGKDGGIKGPKWAMAPQGTIYVKDEYSTLSIRERFRRIRE